MKRQYDDFEYNKRAYPEYDKRAGESSFEYDMF